MGHFPLAILKKSCEYAKQSGFRGVWTIGQDNNLAACLFYINNGFRIGGLDTEVYNGTKLEGMLIYISIRTCDKQILTCGGNRVCG